MFKKECKRSKSRYRFVSLILGSNILFSLLILFIKQYLQGIRQKTLIVFHMLRNKVLWSLPFWSVFPIFSIQLNFFQKRNQFQRFDDASYDWYPLRNFRNVKHTLIGSNPTLLPNSTHLQTNAFITVFSSRFEFILSFREEINKSCLFTMNYNSIFLKRSSSRGEKMEIKKEKTF